MNDRTLLLTLGAMVGLLLLASGWAPYDRGTWLLEVAPIFIAVPVLVARELFVRRGFVRGRGMVAFLCVCVSMAISAGYELLEWGGALALGQGADEFLGTQGYVWDTQSDIWYALLSAGAALLLFSRWHDREIARLGALSARGIT